MPIGKARGHVTNAVDNSQCVLARERKTTMNSRIFELSYFHFFSLWANYR